MRHGEYELAEGLDRMDLAMVHTMLRGSYWAQNCTLEEVERAAQNSTLLLGAFFEGRQVAYLRVVSDKATFGWISDVIVERLHRGKGLARVMVDYALRHPEHQGFRRWVLKTRDAHGVYEACGFRVVPDPGDWMIHDPRSRRSLNAQGAPTAFKETATSQTASQNDRTPEQ